MSHYIPKRVTRKESKIARCRAHKILQDLHKELEGKYRFSERLVGSASWGTIVKDINGEYDLDYQILLTKNCQEYKDNQFTDSTKVKRDFLKTFNRIKNKDEMFEDSTTAITLKNKSDSPFHIDFVIIKLFPENHLIIRRNNKKETQSNNEYTWNELPNFNEAYNKFIKLSIKEKRDLIENYVIPKKIQEKMKMVDDSTKKTSTEVFIMEINNYVNKRKSR